MANPKSGTVTVKVTNYDNLVFSWQETVNWSGGVYYSNIDWNMKLVAIDSGRIDSSANKTWVVTINGTKYTGTNSVAIGNNSTITLASGSHYFARPSATSSYLLTFSFSQEFNITFSGSSIGTKSGSGSETLDPVIEYAYFTSVTYNFTDEDNPTINYGVPNPTTVISLQACLTFDRYTIDVPYRDIPKNGSSYTFTLTDAERNTLRSKMTTVNSKKIYYCIKTVIGDNTYLESYPATISIANGDIVIDSIIIQDNKATTVNLTGNAGKLVRGYSNASVSISATPQKQATITSYKIENSGQVINADSGIFYGVNNKTFVFTVTDSRGNIKTQTIEKSFVDYIDLTCHLRAVANSGTGKIDLTISGAYYNGSFGATNNSLSVQYRYKLADSSSYSSWMPVVVSLAGDGSSYLCNKTINGLDYTKKYDIQAMATDKIHTTGVLSNTETISAMTVFDWSKTDFNFNVPVNINGNLTIDGNISASNFGPSNLPTVGTWTPVSNVCSSPDAAYGNYIKTGNVVIINFYYQGTATVDTPDKLTFSGLPFTPNDSYGWQAGGGNCTNYAVKTTTSSSPSSDVKRAGHRFVGWSIENNTLYGRTQDMLGYTSEVKQSSPPYTTTWLVIGDSYYITIAKGSTFYASGTIMYKTES